MRIYSIGHSNRSMDEFLNLLEEFEIRCVADIRRFPGSRAFPHFGKDNLAKSLADRGIKYAWLEDLGGRRRSRSGSPSPNSGLENPGFRAYADYMASDRFRHAARELMHLASSSQTAYMCAEALYWRCHRRLLSDYLTASGLEVVHVLGLNQSVPHTMTQGAIPTENGGVAYPQPQS